MDIKKLQTLVVDALEDVKAQDIKVYDTTHLTSLFDRICIASGTSNRQTKSLASSVRDKVKENGGDIVGIEGEDVGEWVLVDLGDMVVHIMQPVIRGYYRLEELWGDKEIKMGAAKRISKRTAEVVEEDAEPVKRVRSNINQATQTTLDDETKKPARKPRAAAVATDETKPKRASRAKVADADAAAAPKKPRVKKAIGTTIKVAASKTAVASAKQAAVKRTTAKRKAAV
ncbi:ribosome silencing factor [Solimicrobium silvestre]|uniref:Ribosomal silencing factor RsfS n=1 Tax=Solimicrobium silvestre TaxID=2099400 RepID=A0A2S9GYP3_9BURK|nr:ribosome silencing factor [Solimicrobium silvestre]PRC92820.1 Iojap-like ribosome-associated protein [Solimicrobium silvestre]